MFNLLIMILIINFGGSSHCGIPIFTWCFVYFIITGVKSLNNLFKLYILRNFPQYGFKYQLISFLIIDGVFMLWLIYGNIIFYSDDNNCKDDEASRVLFNLMFVMLVIGYFQMLVYFLMVCCLPCVIWYLRR